MKTIIKNTLLALVITSVSIADETSTKVPQKLSIQQVEALKAILPLKGKNGKNIFEVFGSLAGKTGTEKSKFMFDNMDNKSLSLFFMNCKIIINDKNKKSILFLDKETPVSSLIMTNKFGGAKTAFETGQAMQKYGTSLVGINNLENIIWNKSTEKESIGSFYLNTDFGFSAEFLFKATNTNNKLKIYSAYIKNKKEPNSFKNSLKIF